MEQKRSIRLVLKTSDLTANSTTTIGQCDQFRTSFTWFNINLRNLLGDLYNQYDYFNLLQPDELELEIELTENDLKCYSYYLKIIDDLRNRIVSNKNENKYDIKSPTKWLQKFESDTGLKREEFKQFINSYELKNITSIIEDIKAQGNIEYKGAQSFKIAKKRSESQETFWEILLKEKYKDEIGRQFQFGNCIFDFINISKNTIYECKLGLKDFNQAQYDKYLMILNKFEIIYLIDNDCAIFIKDKVIYTSNMGKYIFYICNIPLKKKENSFDEILLECEIKEIDDINSIFVSK
jgi:hypothetical protein